MSTQISSPINPKEAERRVIRLGTFEDGLWDILLGCTFLILSIYGLTRQLLGPALNAAWIIVAILLLIGAAGYVRRVFSSPRIGLMRFRRRRLTTITRITLFVVLVSLVLATALISHLIPQPAWAGAPRWVNDLAIDILFSALIIGFFSLLAHFTGVPRLHLYGWLIGLGNLASTTLDLYAGFTFQLPLALAGGSIVLIGVGLFIGFLRRYPLPAEEA